MKFELGEGLRKQSKQNVYYLLSKMISVYKSFTVILSCNINWDKWYIVFSIDAISTYLNFYIVLLRTIEGLLQIYFLVYLFFRKILESKILNFLQNNILLSYFEYFTNNRYIYNIIICRVQYSSRRTAGGATFSSTRL